MEMCFFFMQAFIFIFWYPNLGEISLYVHSTALFSVASWLFSLHYCNLVQSFTSVRLTVDSRRGGNGLGMLSFSNVGTFMGQLSSQQTPVVTFHSDIPTERRKLHISVLKLILRIPFRC